MTTSSFLNEDGSWFIYRGGPLSDYNVSVNELALVIGVRIEAPTVIGVPTPSQSLQDNISSTTTPSMFIDIPDGAFQNLPMLEKVIIPAHLVRRIGRSAFRNATALREVCFVEENDNGNDIDGNQNDDKTNSKQKKSNNNNKTNPSTTAALTIGRNAFHGCKMLQTINLPKGTRKIGNFCFRNCSSLIGDSNDNDKSKNKKKGIMDWSQHDQLCFLGDGLFEGCSSLKGVLLPENYLITTIPQSCFLGCSSLETMIIPEGVQIIADYAFHSCHNLKSIQLPNKTLLNIQTQAFYDCYQLQEMHLPSESLQEPLGEECMAGCRSLTTITLPRKNLPSMGVGMLARCPKLYQLHVSGGGIPTTLWPQLLAQWGSHRLFEPPRLLERAGVESAECRNACIFSFLQEHTTQLFGYSSGGSSQEQEAQQALPNPFATATTAATTTTRPAATKTSNASATSLAAAVFFGNNRTTNAATAVTTTTTAKKPATKNKKKTKVPSYALDSKAMLAFGLGAAAPTGRPRRNQNNDGGEDNALDDEIEARFS